WVHHANIDRLWASWDALSGGRRPPDDPAWLNQEFVFFDVDMTTQPPGQPKAVSITVQQVLTTEALGYQYDRLAEPPVAVAAVPAPPAALPLRPAFQPLATSIPPRAKPEAPHPGATGAIQLTTAKAKVVPLALGEKVKPAQVRNALTAKPE